MAETTVPTRAEAEVPATREESRYLAPPVDIVEDEQGLTVVADLPGVTKENVSIRVDNNTLTIEGRTRHIAPGEPVRCEYQLMNFYRQFVLGEEVDQDQISADMRQGVLTVRLPKKAKAKPRQIDVKVS